MLDSTNTEPSDDVPVSTDAAADAVPPEQVRRALASVLDSEELSSSPQLSNILRFVVEATLEGRRDAIKGYTIAVEALGRDASFDPQADPIVRVEATRLRRALERYYAGAGANDEIEIVVPRGSYVPQFTPRRPSDAGVGVPVPGTAEPATQPAGPDEGDPVVLVPADAGRRWSLRGFVAGALVLLVAVVLAGIAIETVEPVAWRALVSSIALRPIERANRLGMPMVEVRPFDSTGGAPLPPSEITRSAGVVTSGEFTARAIEVRVRDALARFDMLDVLASPEVHPVVSCGSAGVSPYSAFALGGLVENHEDGSMSVLLRLSDLCDGTIVWSREFDSLKPGGDPSATEVALVRDIMAAIAEPYGVIQARARARVTASGGPDKAGPYGCVLDAYSYWRSYLPAEHRRARQCLERSVAADSTFALGYALLAELDLDEIRTGVEPRSDQPVLDRALAAAEQAVELEPTSAFAQRVLMDVHFFRGERSAAIASGQTSLALNPYDMDVLADFAGRLIAFGEVERGEKMLASATQAAPGMPPWVDFYRVIAAYLRGDAPGAASAADQLMGDGYAPGLLARALASNMAGEREAAQSDLRKLVEIAPAWRTEPRLMIERFFPDPSVALRVANDLADAGLPIPKSSAAAD
ncbi:tetratricopeptide repeat protein [Ancylobacter mangrovi]|uniref:tetratricopeptide repeat protein n=1 Tax=Ancylobacter mangrovi TaxID=2972472 RepID=UPI00216267F6|nr:hypothetical protein [Ancylobacter mangrovi]MCS0503048.1 hypothetical protein [Ancylobacter mangrovi]